MFFGFPVKAGLSQEVVAVSAAPAGSVSLATGFALASTDCPSTVIGLTAKRIAPIKQAIGTRADKLRAGIGKGSIIRFLEGLGGSTIRHPTLGIMLQYLRSD